MSTRPVAGAVAELQRRLRSRAEHVLLRAAMDDLRRRHPEGTTAAYPERGEAAWRRLFVPLYRRVPWETKVRAMRARCLTAERHGWAPPARRPGEPWRPPPPADVTTRRAP